MTPTELRQLVVDTAAREENSTDALKYWTEVLPPNWRGLPPPHWCGAFTLWVLRTVLNCPWTWEVNGILGAHHSGYLYHLPTTNDPQLGDVCYMAAPYQHHAILTAIGRTPEGIEYVISQDGNSGPSPGICQEQWRKRSKWTAFYSIQPLIDAEIARIG